MSGRFGRHRWAPPQPERELRLYLGGHWSVRARARWHRVHRDTYAEWLRRMGVTPDPRRVPSADIALRTEESEEFDDCACGKFKTVRAAVCVWCLDAAGGISVRLEAATGRVS